MALAGLQNLTGTELYVATGEPATYDVAGYEALSWEKVVGLVSIGAWGDSFADVNEPLLSEGRVVHTAGNADGGEVAVAIQFRDTDAGRDILRTNAGQNAAVALKKVYPNGDGEYAVAYIGGIQSREATNDSVRGEEVTAWVNTEVLFATESEISAAGV